MIQVRDLELIFHYRLLLSKTLTNVRLGRGLAVVAVSPHSYSEGREVNPAVRGS